MAGRRRVRGSHVVALCLLLVALVGCGGRPATDTVRADVQRLLDRRAAALLAHDATAYAGTGAAGGYARVRAVPLEDFSYRVGAVHGDGAARTADVRLSYRVRGYDRAPVTARRTVRLARGADGGWAVTAETPAPGAGAQLWDQGTVDVVRGERSLVMGVGQSGERLRTFADLADRAVPAVAAAWGTGWTLHVVVLVPKSLAGMAALLGSPASSYRGIAAVTTGETGGPPRAPADRIVVNPDAYGMLGAVGRQVVLTHETTHVATRAHTNAATPLWLSEGYADYVGYRDTGRTPTEVAPELVGAVAGGDAPAALPTDADFGFSGDAVRLAEAYEGGWLACRMIAGRWGEERLDAFYRAVGAHGKRAGAVEGALRSVLGTSLADFTADWRQYVHDQLAAPAG